VRLYIVNKWLRHLYIVSYNSSQTLKFAHLKTFFEPYAPKIWTQAYVYHNIREYEVTLAIVMEKTFFYFLIR
jgi:hypothetical protein